MLQIQLYIEGQEVELYQDESITLTQSIQDVRDIEKIFTDYTRTFTVPASKNNNKIFKHFYNYFIEGFDARTKKSAEIHLNYKPFKKGKIRLEGASLRNNEAANYRITFFGNTVLLPDLLGEDKLANLTELSSFDFRYNDTNIEAFLTDGKDAVIGAEQITDGIIFPLITHTNRLIYDSSLNETYNLYTTGSNNGVPFTELKPALKLYAIIKAIETHYDIKFSTDFFNKDNAAFYNLYIWLHTKAGGLFIDQDKAQQFTRLQITGDKFDELIVRSNNFRINNADVKIEFHYKVTITPALGSAKYNLVIQRNGQEFKRFNDLTGTKVNGINVADYTPENNAIIVDNGEFTFFIETASATTFDMEILLVRVNTRFLGGNKSVTLNSTLETFTDTNISIVSQLPDIKILDFLIGIFKMFNLTAYVNDSNIIVVQTLNDYYNSSNITHDITPFVISDESQVDAPIPYKQVNLTYEGLDTFLAKTFKQLNNKGWGTLEYQSQAKYEGSFYEIKLPFEHVLFERLNDINTGALTNVQWGWFVDEAQQSSSGKPLLFYAVKSGSGSIATRNIANDKVDVSDPYMPSNSLTTWTGTTIDDMTQSLNFHSEIDEYVRIPNEKTLFKTYYEGYIKDLFDLRKRITKISAFLPLRITETLTLADNIRIFDKLYRINELTTNFETNKSDLVLTNIISTQSVGGTDTIIPIAAPTNTNKYNTNYDSSTDELTADSTVFTADYTGGLGNEDFDSPPLDEEINTNISGNDITNDGTQPCDVTPATISTGTKVNGTDYVEFSFDILDSGTICDIPNIDEYGFLIASQQSYLTASDNIDTLKANANITTVSTIRLEGSPSLTVGTKQKRILNLTHPATRYARFYVKTNNNINFAEANVISSVISATTDPGDTLQTSFFVLSAGAGNVTGYSTIPTLAEIDAKQNVTQGAGKCGEFVTFEKWYHNGNRDIPRVNDKIKIATTNDYTGGSNSFPTISGTSSGIGKYMALAISVDNVSTQPYYSLITNYIVVEFDTATVVASYQCPASLCDPDSYLAGGRLLNNFTISEVATIGAKATPVELNKTSSKGKEIATYVGMLYSTVAKGVDGYSAAYTAIYNNSADIVLNYIRTGSLPANVGIVYIEESNATENGSVTQWFQGTLSNSTQVIRKTGMSPGIYTVRMFMGWCNSSDIRFGIQKGATAK